MPFSLLLMIIVQRLQGAVFSQPWEALNKMAAKALTGALLEQSANLFKMIYCMAGNFGGEFILADWQQSANISSAK